jgi:ABC-type xylose transport system substrate-binding protein
MIDVPAILLEPIAVDKDNMKTTVIADGHIKEADLN